MKMIALALAAVLLGSSAAMAADDAPKFSVKPTGRILMDGAMYFDGNDNIDANDTRFVDGVAIPDVRLGAKASYGKWKAKIDIGFGYGKLSMKDIYLEYGFNDANLIRAGYFVPQWGLNSETSSSMKPTYEEPSANEFFYANPRLLAAMWQYDKGDFFSGVSVFAEAAAMTNNATAMGKQAWGAENRFVWRPRHATGDVVQIGISLNYSSPTDDNHSGFAYTAAFPSRVSKVTNLSATVDHARGLFKMTPELLLARGRFALESQYYYMNIARKDGYHNYKAQGVYALLRSQLIGNGYVYSHADAGLATPAKGTLELNLCYNYVDASDAKAEVWGGRSHDVSATLNYYINSWMLARLRYSYTTVNDRVVEDLTPSRHVNTLEARVQIIF